VVLTKTERISVKNIGKWLCFHFAEHGGLLILIHSENLHYQERVLRKKHSINKDNWLTRSAYKI
jgi:hypothetical protein